MLQSHSLGTDSERRVWTQAACLPVLSASLTALGMSVNLPGLGFLIPKTSAMTAPMAKAFPDHQMSKPC